MSIVDKVKFHERFDNDFGVKDSDITEFYFLAGVELLNEFFGDEYSDAEGAVLCIECPTDHISGSCANSEISPYRMAGDMSDCYDWQPFALPTSEKEALIQMALKAEKGEKN